MDGSGQNFIHRCVMRDESLVDFFGELPRFSLGNKESALVRLSSLSNYEEVRNLTCTTHRLHYIQGSDVLAIRLDAIVSYETRGGFVKSKKLVLGFGERGQACEFSIRILDKERFESLISVISSVLKQKEWLRTGGYALKPMLGGITRVVARVEQADQNRGALVDAGLTDLNSMRNNARQLNEIISQINRGANAQEISEINTLLSEYGLLNREATCVSTTESTSAKSISSLVISAVQSAGGVILVHDLYCLINRKLKLERVYSPKEFLVEISRIASVNIMNIRGYKAVVSLNVQNLNDTILPLLNVAEGAPESILSNKLSIKNIFVLHLLLLKVEESFGKIVRDEFDDSTYWYLNAF